MPGTDPTDRLTRSIEVPVPPRAAWDAFVHRFAAWWPRAYSFSADRLAAIGLEPEAGGRCWERDLDGRELQWGTVQAAEPPHRLVFRWQITADRRIEPDPERASEVEVRFEPISEGTRVTLDHRAFARHGPGWEAYRDGMGSEQGWPYCLRMFRDHAAPASG